MHLVSHDRVTDEAAARPKPAAARHEPFEWYALWLMSNSEFMVAGALDAHGVENYLPTYEHKTEWSDRTKVSQRPLFPGYVFVRIVADAPSVAELLGIAGVVKILPDSNKPVPMDGSEIENLRMALNSQQAAVPCEYVAGDEVVIDSGALAGVKGVVVRTKGSPGESRLVVKIEMLRRAVSVELDAGNVVRKAA